MGGRRVGSSVHPVVVGAVVGCVIGALAAIAVAWQAAVLIGWDAAAVTFLVWIWSTIGRLDATATARIATREDPSRRRGLGDRGRRHRVPRRRRTRAAEGRPLLRGAKAAFIAIGLLSVALSWAALHTVFTLKYARLYYGGKKGGVDFNEPADPDYLDFAYLAFTIGLTFQVSDTDIGDKPIRRTALRHALLAFLFGAVIIGLSINVVASLLK